jgi:hypothetical protein
MMPTPNPFRMKSYCPTRTCETSYVFYLMFTGEGPRYRSPIRESRTNQRSKS